jgi:hypothetical protein
MKPPLILFLGIALTAWSSGKTVAQEGQPGTESIEAELDTFREGLFQAFNQGNYEAMLEKYCHKDAIAMWPDGTSSRGHDGALAEFDKLSKFIDKMTVHPETDMRLILNDGKTVIASGNLEDEYALRRGVQVALKSRWTATLIKEDDKWVLVSFSASADAFDNEVVSLYLRNTMFLSAGIASVAGLIVGVLGALLVFKRRPRTTRAGQREEDSED